MNPRRYSQIERALHILDKSATVDILKEDQYLLFYFKKTERIVVALYVITGLFPDAEPLKWRLREVSTLLIGHSLSFKERATVHSKEFLSDTFAEIAHLLSLVDLAYVADLISPMNFSVLKKEIESMKDIIDGKWRIQNFPASPPFLTEGFFGLPKELFPEPKESSAGNALPSSSGTAGTGDVLVQSVSDFEQLKRSSNQKEPYKGHKGLKDSVFYNKVLRGSPSHKPVIVKKQLPHQPIGQVKQERREHIFSVLRQRGSAMIKDFSSVITGCSEKTVQRLLIEMVQSGVLKREGDRRWSRYSIAMPPKDEMALQGIHIQA